MLLYDTRSFGKLSGERQAKTPFPSLWHTGESRYRPNSYRNLFRAATSGLQKSSHQNHDAFTQRQNSFIEPELIYDNIFSKFHFGAGREHKITVVILLLQVSFSKPSSENKSHEVFNTNKRVTLKDITKLDLKCKLRFFVICVAD